MAYIVPGLFVVLGLVIVLVRLWRTWHAPARTLCPGPGMPASQRLWPMWLIYRPRCGYDLSGHLGESSRALVCPECGRQVEHRRQLLRHAGAWRWVNIGCVCVATGFLIHRHPPLAATTLVEYAPTDLLLRGEGLLGVGTPLEVRAEIRKRAMAFQLDEAQVCAFVRLLVSDLRDDELESNARQALQQLAMFAAFCEQPLLEALDSSDAQQRGLAARVLRSLPVGDDVTQRLVEIAVDDLRDDDRVGNSLDAFGFVACHVERVKPQLIAGLDSHDEQFRRNAVHLLRKARLEGEVLDRMIRMAIEDLAVGQWKSEVRSALVFLVRNADAAEPRLRAAMLDGDARQKLLCAAAAGCGSRTDLMDMAVPILVRHLADNRISDDGIVAARSLWGFGPEVLPLLEPWRSSSDEQQRQCVEYIVRRMTTTDSVLSLKRRLPKARLTGGSSEAIQIAVEYLPIPRMSTE